MPSGSSSRAEATPSPSTMSMMLEVLLACRSHEASVPTCVMSASSSAMAGLRRKAPKAALMLGQSGSSPTWPQAISTVHHATTPLVLQGPIRLSGLPVSVRPAADLPRISQNCAYRRVG